MNIRQLPLAATRANHDPVAGSQTLCYDQVSLPIFVYNFEEDRYLWISKLLGRYIDREKCLREGLRGLADRVHPEDFELLYSTHLTDLRKRCAASIGNHSPGVNSVSFRLSNERNEWIQASIKADIVGYNGSGKPNCIFGLLLVDEPARDSAATTDESAGKITAREWEVLNLLRKGRSSREISAQLSISFHTVESYRKRLLQKFNVRNTPELIALTSEMRQWPQPVQH